VLRIGLCALLLIVAVDLRSGVHTGLDVEAGLVLKGTAGFGIGRALSLDTGKTWGARRRM
jgi:hypothetical protein